MKDVIWDDYIAAQIDAIDTVCSALDVPDVHTIGYCVAGTTLAATLAVLAATDAADKVRSATFLQRRSISVPAANFCILSMISRLR